LTKKAITFCCFTFSSLFVLCIVCSCTCAGLKYFQWWYHHIASWVALQHFNLLPISQCYFVPHFPLFFGPSFFSFGRFFLGRIFLAPLLDACSWIVLFVPLQTIFNGQITNSPTSFRIVANCPSTFWLL